MNRFTTTRLPRTAGALIVACSVGFGATSCSQDVDGTAGPAASSTTRLDTGNYPTTPRTIGNAKSAKQGSARESQRLADFVALPFEVDPAFDTDRWMPQSHIVLNRKALGTLVINDTFDDVTKGLEAGWVNSHATPENADGKNRSLSITVLQFPDAQTAKVVGPTLENDDFTYNRDNQPVDIGAHADTKAHWRPGVSSIGSWTVKGRFVVFVKYDDNTSAPDLPALTAMVERTLAVQLPLLDAYTPTPAAELARIPLDPEGLLGRTLPTSPDSPSRAEPDGTYTGRGAMTLFAKPNAGTYAELRAHQVDLVSAGAAVVFRSKDATSSQALWTAWRPSDNLSDTDGIVDKMAAAPTGLGERSECYQKFAKNTDSQTLLTNFCIFQVDRYTVQLEGRQLQELHQRASAQYELLVGK